MRAGRYVQQAADYFVAQSDEWRDRQTTLVDVPVSAAQTGHLNLEGGAASVHLLI